MALPKPWLVRLAPSPSARLRLFCFPCGGVGASLFKAWPSALGPRIDVCALHPPGREARRSEPSITESGPFLDAVVGAIRPLLDRPFAFFGHSMGTLVAFALARRLRREGARMPVHLFVSSHPAPQWPGAHKELGTDAAFVEELRRLNGLPRAVLDSPELMDVMLPILRADHRLHGSFGYQDEAPLGLPISAFAGEDDPTAIDAELTAWGAQTSARFAYQRLPGDHFHLSTHPGPLLDAIRQGLGPLGR